MSVFQGSGVALITPFTRDGVNFAVLNDLVDFHLKNQTDAIVACGTTGEPSTMKTSEKLAVIRAVVDRVKGAIPVIAGTGGNDTAECVEQSLAAKDAGADALLIVTPYYNKTTQAGMIKHYEVIADAARLPIIIYNVPSRTGLNMSPATLASLAGNPYIAGMKEASGDIKQITEMARLTRSRIDLYSGNDDHIVPVMSVGGVGVISVLANVAPRLTHELVARWLKGDTNGSLAMQMLLNPLVESLFVEVNPIPVKAAMRILGFDVGPVRLPLVELTHENEKILRIRMEELGLIRGGTDA